MRGEGGRESERSYAIHSPGVVEYHLPHTETLLSPACTCTLELVKMTHCVKGYSLCSGPAVSSVGHLLAVGREDHASHLDTPQ